MNAATEARRVRWGYEPDTPQCCTCVKYRKARATEDRLDPPFCTGGKFPVQANGCCDRWVDKKTGERLA